MSSQEKSVKGLIGGNGRDDTNPTHPDRDEVIEGVDRVDSDRPLNSEKPKFRRFRLMNSGCYDENLWPTRIFVSAILEVEESE